MFPFTSASKNDFFDFHISQGLYWESPSLSPYPLLVYKNYKEKNIHPQSHGGVVEIVLCDPRVGRVD